MSSIWTSSPRAPISLAAALRMRSRLRRASARCGRGAVTSTFGATTASWGCLRGVDKRNLASVSCGTGTQLPILTDRDQVFQGAPMDATTARDRRWIALILLCAAQFVVVLDASIVNVALPSIQRDLHFSQEDLQWVVNAYVLMFGGFMLLGGRAADLLGRRRVFMFGLVVFSLASLAGGLAGSQEMLIAARAVQGLGAAILSPAALSIITVTFAEGADRNKALGVWGAVAGSGGAAGVILGGVITQSLGWEWVLFVNAPIGLAAALLTPFFVTESRREVAERRFDIAGAVSVTGGLLVLVYGVVRAADVGWGSAETIGLLAAAVALLVAFTLIEART